MLETGNFWVNVINLHAITVCVGSRYSVLFTTLLVSYSAALFILCLNFNFYAILFIICGLAVHYKFWPC